MTPEHIAGVDEAGRGPLAGPVVAAAVILDPARPIKGLADSKALTAGRREALETEIRACALSWAVGFASHEEIDRINILRATFAAMRRALRQLDVPPTLCLIDGNRPIPGLPFPQRTVVDGDASEPAISAASILAKVCRDRLMGRMDLLYPGYGFTEHKGYWCRPHIEALRRLGPCPIHRRSFAPVAALLQGEFEFASV